MYLPQAHPTPAWTYWGCLQAVPGSKTHPASLCLSWQETACLCLKEQCAVTSTCAAAPATQAGS